MTDRITPERKEELKIWVQYWGLGKEPFNPLVDDEGAAYDLLAILDQPAPLGLPDMSYLNTGVPARLLGIDLPAPPTSGEMEEMARWLHKGCLHCDDRLFGGDDCEGISPYEQQNKCYAIKQAIRSLLLAPAPKTVTREELDGVVSGMSLPDYVRAALLERVVNLLRSLGLRVEDKSEGEDGR